MSIKRQFYCDIKHYKCNRTNIKMFKDRLGLVERLRTFDWARPFFNNEEDVLPINVIALRQVVIEYSSLNQNVYPAIIGDNKNSVEDMLLGAVGSGFNIKDLALYDLIDVEYEFRYDRYDLYLNTASDGPIIKRQLGRVDIWYRELFPGIIDEFLKNVVTYFGTDLIYSEPLRLGFRSALSAKRSIISKFLGVDITHIKDDVVNDVYTNLIRIANCDLDKTKIERLSILNSIKERMLDRMKSGEYVNVVSQVEEDEYKAYFELLNHNLQQLIDGVRIGKLPFDIKEYYNVDQNISECNRYKQEYGWVKSKVINMLVHNKEISSIILDVHPDIVMSINVLFLHLELLGLSHLYSNKSCVCQYIRNITSPELRRKPILIKFLIKNSTDERLHDLKERGYISMHQLENFLGYRVTKVLVDEVKDDYMAWFNQGREKNGQIQASFIHKWAKSFFESKNYKGRVIADIMRGNIRKYRNIEEILGSITSYMHSKGAVDDVRVPTCSGKPKGISKNDYFNLVESQSDYKIRGDRRNKVIIKREEYIKQRIVINSTLDTFVPLSKINKVLSVLTGGCGITYFSNSKKQKAEHYSRLISYLDYNKCNYRRWLCMPLDYSSYDHTITLDLLEAVVDEISTYFGLIKMKEWFNQFKRLLKREVVYFDVLGQDKDNNQHYKYGVLSGWKITSSMESIANAIVTYGVMQELRLHLEDYETMGDDLIILLDLPNLDRHAQLDVLERVCKYYESLGFIMNVPKNSVGYFFLEFLRVTFRPCVVQCYPSRIIGSLFYLKPGRAAMNFGADEMVGVINKVCKRYGCLSRRQYIARYASEGFRKEDVRLNLVGYVNNPAAYEVLRSAKVDFIYNVDVESTPMYKRYIYIFGKQFESDVKRVIFDNVITQKRVVTRLVRKHGRVEQVTDWQMELIAELVNKYGHYTPGGDEDFFYLPEYHMIDLLDRIVRRSHFNGLDSIKRYIMGCFERMFNIGMVRAHDLSINQLLLSHVTDYAQLKALFKDDKVSISEYNMPAIIMSRYKEALKRGLVCSLKVLTGREFQFVRSLLNKAGGMVRVILGKLMNIRNELMAMYSNVPIAMMAD